MGNVFIKCRILAKAFFQRLFISVQLYNGNGLANHAAACSYGFLLSMAPILLSIAFILTFALKASPAAIMALLDDIPVLENLFNKEWLNSDFFTFSKPGISGVVSAVGIIWAGRILSLSMQRGLKVIFPGEKGRNPVADIIVTLTIEAVVLIIILTVVLGSRAAMWIYRRFDFIPGISLLLFITSHAWLRVSSVFLLWLFSFLAYLFVPVNRPRKLSALQGALICTIAYSCVALFLEFILNISRYNFLYGALGSLVVLLVNVFFFFNFFFMGAQFAFAADSFEPLFFSKLRQLVVVPAEEAKTKKSAADRIISRLLYKLFYPHNGRMTRYLRCFEKGMIIFRQKDSGDDIYYLLEGQVEVLPSASQDSAAAGLINAGSFFGEKGHLLSEERTATIRAKTDVSVFVLPPHLFDAVLKFDTGLDRDIIAHITRRLKNSNDRIAAL